MKKISDIILAINLIFLINFSAEAQEGRGRAYYDFGVFAYEDGYYDDAEKNFRKALEFEPDNPYYNHYLGKTYLKTARYSDAGKCFEKAWKADSDIPGLKYDMAFLDYKMSEYPRAARGFKAIASEEPENVLASYYAGICLYNLARYQEAVGYFIRSAEASPTISVNGYYYAGICYQKSGDIENATKKFAYVKEHADSVSLRENAAKWIGALENERKLLRPYSLYLKLGRRYDDNVRLLPPDQEIVDDQGEDKGDYVTVGYFSGGYKFVRERLSLGAGYSHYQTWYDDLNRYDLTGSILSLYTSYDSHPFAFRFSYLPSYYWTDSESYLRRHQFKPEVMWEIFGRLITRLTYSYYDDKYLQSDDRSGNSHEVFLDLFYGLPNASGSLFGSLGYEKNDASHPNYDYGQFKAKIGISLYLPWKLNLKFTGKYYDKKYDAEEGEKRDDNKYSGSVSLSRSLFYDWLDICTEFSYTENDSNFKDYDYERKMTTLSLTARF